MTTNAVVVGVDVAKDRLDVAVRPSGEVWSEANDEAGITALVTRLRPLGPALIVCEATGGFERAAIAALAAAGFPVVVANPRQVDGLVAAVRARWPMLPLGLHFHDTRGLGLANVLAGLEAGVSRYDADDCCSAVAMQGCIRHVFNWPAEGGGRRGHPIQAEFF